MRDEPVLHRPSGGIRHCQHVPAPAPWVRNKFGGGVRGGPYVRERVSTPTERPMAGSTHPPTPASCASAAALLLMVGLAKMLCWARFVVVDIDGAWVTAMEGWCVCGCFAHANHQRERERERERERTRCGKGQTDPPGPKCNAWSALAKTPRLRLGPKTFPAHTQKNVKYFNRLQPRGEGLRGTPEKKERLVLVHTTGVAAHGEARR